MTAPRVLTAIKWVRNMGDYESLHIELGLEVDARPEESPREAQERVYGMVSDFLMEKVRELEAEVKGATKAARKG